MRNVAVIDIGSNTLKILVANGQPLRVIAKKIENVRISPIKGEPAGAISRRAQIDGAAAILRLLDVAKKNDAARVKLVATSMVRDAENGADFCDAVRNATGLPVEILDGESEARGIAAGVLSDPEIAPFAKNGLRIFDLGGGSLEYILLNGTGEISTVKSWGLGAVRLTNQFFSAPESPVPESEIRALAGFVESRAGAILSASPAVPFVGCGGAISACGKIFGEKFAEKPVRIPVSFLREFRDYLAKSKIQKRAIALGKAAPRADIFPAALTIILVIAELSGTDEFLFSRRNLRFGIAQKMIEKEMSLDSRFTVSKK